VRLITTTDGKRDRARGAHELRSVTFPLCRMGTAAAFCIFLHWLFSGPLACVPSPRRKTAGSCHLRVLQHRWLSCVSAKYHRLHQSLRYRPDQRHNLCVDVVAISHRVWTLVASGDVGTLLPRSSASTDVVDSVEVVEDRSSMGFSFKAAEDSSWAADCIGSGGLSTSPSMTWIHGCSRASAALCRHEGSHVNMGSRKSDRSAASLDVNA